MKNDGYLHQFPRYHKKILLGYFNGKIGRENIYKPMVMIIYMKSVMIMGSE